MTGINYYKAEPTRYVMKYRNGKLVREGRGLSFFYLNGISTIIEVPLESRELPFIFSELTADYQELTIQGQCTWQIHDPHAVAEQVDCTLKDGKYHTEDFAKLPERILNIVQEMIRTNFATLRLNEALKKGHTLNPFILEQLVNSEELKRMGIVILAFRITAVRPNPETARALEAEMREQVLQNADEAIYRRRNAAVEQERLIQENELNTEIAVKEKERQIQVKAIKNEEEKLLAKTRMAQIQQDNEIELEEKNQSLISMQAENIRKLGEAEAFKIEALMKAYNEINPHLMEAVKFNGMNPVQILAEGFHELAKNNGTIGQLNITPDILSALANAGDVLRKGG